MKTYIARIVNDDNVRYEFSIEAFNEESAVQKAVLEFMRATEYRELTEDCDEAVVAIIEKGMPFTIEGTSFYNVEAYLDIKHSAELMDEDDIDLVSSECRKLIDWRA